MSRGSMQITKATVNYVSVIKIIIYFICTNIYKALPY